jgi:STE24 endopeptidase
LAPQFPYEFDPGLRARARLYERGSRRLALVGGRLLPVAFAAALWVTGAARAVADGARAAAGGSALAADTLGITGFALLFAAVTLPVAFYSSHVRERRWGMTSRGAAAFAKDAAKGALLGTVFALALLLPFFYLARRFELWWLVASAVYLAHLLFSSVFLPNLLLLFFNKVEPLPDGPLRASILELTGTAGVPPIRDVVVVRESAKSPRANASVRGIGPTRRIVLFDTLLEDFHPREVRFTVAHEVGHLAHRDVPRAFALIGALVLPEMWVLQVALGATDGWFGVRGAADVAAVPLLLLVVSLVSLADGVALSFLTRSQEARADAFALRATSDPAAFESLMKRMCDRNLIDESPSPLVERLLYSHPSPARRIEAARRFATAASGTPAPAPAPAGP